MILCAYTDFNIFYEDVDTLCSCKARRRMISVMLLVRYLARFFLRDRSEKPRCVIFLPPASHEISYPLPQRWHNHSLKLWVGSDQPIAVAMPPTCWPVHPPPVMSSTHLSVHVVTTTPIIAGLTNAKFWMMCVPFPCNTRQAVRFKWSKWAKEEKYQSRGQLAIKSGISTLQPHFRSVCGE